MTRGVLREFSDDELDAAAMAVTAERAEYEAKFKAEQQAINAERDRRTIQQRVAEVPDEVIAAIRATSPKGK